MLNDTEIVYGIKNIFKRRKIKNLVTVDFETYYNSKEKYSLANMTTTSYIRSPQFKMHCVSIAKNKNIVRNYWGYERASKALHDIDWSTSALIAQNTFFDGFILHEHFGIVPAMYICTRSMSRGLDGVFVLHNLQSICDRWGGVGKVEGYLTGSDGVLDVVGEAKDLLISGCNADVATTRHIAYKMLEHMPEDELELIDYTLKAYCVPSLNVKKSIMLNVHNEELVRKQEVLNNVKSLVSRYLNIPIESITDQEITKALRSRVVFPKLLEDCGVTPPRKVSAQTNEETYAFAKKDLEFLDLLEHPDERVVALVEAKLGVSSSAEETRSLRFLEHSNNGTVPLPLMLNYAAALTQRWGGADKANPQNIKRNSVIRTGIVTPPGHVIVSVDSSQVECRGTATLADEQKLIDSFRNKRDVYCEFASNVYDRPITKADETERFVGKTCILSLGYGSGGPKLKHTLLTADDRVKVDVSEAEAIRLVKTYRDTYSCIPALWKYADELFRTCVIPKSRERDLGPCVFTHQRIWGPNGLSLHYPNAGWIYDSLGREQMYYGTKDGMYKIYGGKIVENIIQWLCRIIVGEQILAVMRQAPRTSKLKVRLASTGKVVEAKTYIESWRAVLLVHDQLDLLVPTKEAKAAEQLMLEAFHTPPVWWPDIPVAGETKIKRDLTK